MVTFCKISKKIKKGTILETEEFTVLFMVVLIFEGQNEIQTKKN